MPRRPRHPAGQIVYHVLNRGNLRAELFHKEGDYAAFDKVLRQAHQRTPLDLFAWCLMPNHWHLVVRPRRGEDLSQFMRWLSVTHTQRWRAHSHSEGQGHLYQGRYKSFPVQSDEHFLALCRYVERNALASRLVERAQDWQWSSLWVRLNGSAEERQILAPWPVDRPKDWTTIVNRPLRQTDAHQIQQCILRNRPFGAVPWQQEMALKLGLEYTFRQRGRPKKKEEE